MVQVHPMSVKEIQVREVHVNDLDSTKDVKGIPNECKEAIGEQLDASQREDLSNLLNRYNDVFI